MKKATGYSIWLMPSGHAYNGFLELILQLSRDYGGPGFEPHVTLIGGLLGSKEEIVSKTVSLVDLLRPLTIKLENVDYLDEFFRCLFIRVKQTDDIVGAYSRAQDTFGLPPDMHWIPHLSILYCDLPSETKRKIIERIGNEFRISFVVRTVHLMLTEGTAENWLRVGAFSLKEQPVSRAIPFGQ
jgi:hypothetical protein